MLRKSIITPCVKVASLVTLMLSLAFTPVYAGPAVVNSDPGLKINELLSKELTTITDNSKLDVTVYSTNTISDADAAKINDSIVKGLPGTNYISIVLNKNATKAGGTTSVNLGPDFRDYLSKDAISNNIVIPNRKRYLPDRPTEFVRAVAKDLVTTIKDKKSFNESLSFAGKTIFLIIIFGIHLFVLVILTKLLAKNYRNSVEVHNKAKQNLAESTNIYTKLLGSSSDLSGYEGVTLSRAEVINNSILVLMDDYKVIQVVPSIKSILFKSDSWNVYESNLSKFKQDALAIQKSIDDFIKAVMSVGGQTKDPLAVVERIEQERKDKEEIEYTIKLVTEKYNMYNLSYTSVLHNLYKDVQRSSTKQQVKQASKVFCDAFDQESKNIISLKRVKDGLKFIHTYLSNNTNTYYDQPISTEMVDLASEAFTASIPYLDYNNLEPLQRYLDQLTIYVEPLREADKLYDNFNTYRNELLLCVNSIKCSYVNEDIATIKQSINNVVFVKAKEYYSTYEPALKTIEQEIKVLTERANKFNSRAKKINNFSEETRKNVLTFLLSKGDFVTFDSTVKQYKLEDEEALYFEELEKKRLEKERQKRLQTENTSVNAVVVNNTPTYVYVDDNLFNSSSSNNSNTSSNDLYSNSSSSDDSYSNSNSTNDSFSDNSSSSVSFNDSSWSSSSSDDISSSSSSSDDDW